MEVASWDALLRILQFAEDGTWRAFPHVFPKVDPLVLLHALVPESERKNFAVRVTAGSFANDDRDQVYSLFKLQGFAGVALESNLGALQDLSRSLAAANESGHVFAELWTPNQRAGPLLHLHNVPQDFDVLQIHTRATDLEVLRNMLDAAYRPKVVVIGVRLDMPPPFEFEAVPAADAEQECTEAEGAFGASLARAWAELSRRRYSLVALEPSPAVSCEGRNEGQAWFVHNEALQVAKPLVSWHGMVRLFWAQVDMKCAHTQQLLADIPRLSGILDGLAGWSRAEMSSQIAQLASRPSVRAYIEEHQAGLLHRCPWQKLVMEVGPPGYASSLQTFLARVRREGLPNPFSAAARIGCPSQCATVSDALWNDTVPYRGGWWDIGDTADDLENAWIRRFGPVRQRIHEVFGCHVPVFVNWFGLLHKDRSDYQPYKRAWATVARAILYNPECNFVALSILDRGPTLPQGSRKVNYLDEMPNLNLFGSSHGHIPIPLVRKASCSMQHRPTRYYIACMGQHGYARSVVLEALR
ncbi:ANKMY2, partial [Symbiodinium sp. CCMP2456]